MTVPVCARGHDMSVPYVRKDGRKDCRTCMRYRRQRAMATMPRMHRGSGESPLPASLRTVPMAAPDDVVVVFSRALAEDITPGLAALAKGQHNEVGRAAAWLYRAIRAEMNNEVAHNANQRAPGS